MRAVRTEPGHPGFPDGISTDGLGVVRNGVPVNDGMEFGTVSVGPGYCRVSGNQDRLF